MNCRAHWCIAILAMIVGHLQVAEAGPVVFTNHDPFAASVYIGSADLSYRHDITDNGYDPAIDNLTSATLAMRLIDDDDDPAIASYGSMMFDFEGADDEELTIHEGEKVYVLRDVGEWLFVLDGSGRRGFVPASYVEQVGSVPEPELYELSLDGVGQGVCEVVGVWRHYSIPASYLTDGILRININRVFGDFVFDDAYLTVAAERTVPAVPLPSSLLLVASGLVGYTRLNRKLR